MRKALIVFLVAALLSVPSLAQDVGIKFDEMPIGTTLVTEVFSSKPFRRSEKYIGKRDEFYVVETSLIRTGGKIERYSTDYYDLKGRLIRRDRSRGFEEYSPYSCHYELGVCVHRYQYPNPFKNYNQTANKRKYITRLEGDTLIVSWSLADGNVAEVPFKLGPYNLRLSSENVNRLGRKTGYKFVDLIEPEKVRGSRISK